MLAMARVSTEEYVQVTNGGGEGTPFPLHPRSSKMAVLFNPEPKGCGCSSIGGGEFSPKGWLGIKAVIYHQNGDVCLVLPYLAAEVDFSNLNAYTTVTVDPAGRPIGRLYRPFIHQESYLKWLLGMNTPGAVRCHPSGESLHLILRVPDPLDYLAVMLLRLGKYFEELAVQLNTGHQH